MKTSVSVGGRALLAIGLMIGFYLLALAISAALVAFPIAEAMFIHRITLKLDLVCIVAAATIIWSIVPRWDRFAAPGPVLEPGRHPKLFAEIGGVARATGQAMPDEVFLVGDVNAWVAQRGGIMGFFGRRVMGLGLPLLQALSVSELRAVLAHEFGHFYGGDTRLGPWVYKTRSAIGRTIAGLGSSWIRMPFLVYGRLFLRISQAVSRRQEFSADALASRTMGSRPLVEGLKKVHVAAAAFDAYWSQEVLPVLQSGFLPPLAGGFQRFTSHARVSRAMAGDLEQRLQNKDADPYDTHPPLAERIAAVLQLPAGPDPQGEPAAISLLSDVCGLERAWLATVADPAVVGKLAPVEWDAVVSTAFFPSWRETVSRQSAALGDATVGDLPKMVAECGERSKRLDVTPGHEGTAQEREGYVRWLVAVATTLALEREGFAIEAPPGAPVCARRGTDEVLPFEVVQGLADQALEGDDWRAEASRLGVSTVPLVVRAED